MVPVSPVSFFLIPVFLINFDTMILQHIDPVTSVTSHYLLGKVTITLFQLFVPRRLLRTERLRLFLVGAPRWKTLSINVSIYRGAFHRDPGRQFCKSASISPRERPPIPIKMAKVKRVKRRCFNRCKNTLLV